jgi:cobalt-zinc-cadmium efflux system protein
MLAGRLRFAITLTALILVGELVGGYFANSLALLSDAGHVFTDMLALGLSWFGVMQAQRPASARMTFGYHRIGILIAVVNALILVALALVIFYEAYRRFQHPEPVLGILMFSVAVIGLAVNLVVMLRLRHPSKLSLNVRSAFLHVLGDALGSVGVIVGGAIIYFSDWYWVDPAISVFIGLIILAGAWWIIKDAVVIFVEATPAHLDVDDLARAIRAVPGVKGMHDLHVWSIAPRIHALSCHVVVADLPLSQSTAISDSLKEMLSARFNIAHSTVQLECEPCEPGELY